MAKLKCKYCGCGFTAQDKKCPGCGANTLEIIEEYEEEQKKKFKDHEDKVLNMVNDGFLEVGKASKIVMFIALGVFCLILIIGISTVVIHQKNKSRINSEINNVIDNDYDKYKENIDDKDNKINEEKNRKFEGTLNQEITGRNYTILIDKVQKFDMVNDFGKGYDTSVQKKGYQQLALHIKIMNNSKVERYISSSYSLLADGVQMEDSEVTELHNFRHEKKGLIMEELPSSVVSNAAIVGWVGYYVIDGAQTIEFRFDDIVIKFDNL